MDGNYSSVELFDELSKKNIQAVGVIRARSLKGLPIYSNPTRGGCVFFKPRDPSLSNLMLIKYQDKKPLWIITTKHKDPLYFNLAPKRPFMPAKNKMPVVVHDYTQHSHGVDICNCETSRYRYAHKSKKWWKWLFYYFLRLAAFNGFIYYKEITKKNITLLEFYEAIIEGFIPLNSID